MERSTIFNGKIHYFNGPCSIATLNYQRVFHHGFSAEEVKDYVGQDLAKVRGPRMSAPVLFRLYNGRFPKVGVPQKNCL